VRGLKVQSSSRELLVSLAGCQKLDGTYVQKVNASRIDRNLRRLFWLKTQKKLHREAKQKLVNAKDSCLLGCWAPACSSPSIFNSRLHH
jgi:hypothetical protein